MTLSPKCVKELQFLLMDAARRSGEATTLEPRISDDLLAGAAALDYVLLLASERAPEMADGAGPIAASIRETVGTAVRIALRVTRDMLAAPDADFHDFYARHLGPTGLFATLQALMAEHVLSPSDFRFEALTTASDVAERARR